jgi:hypothetical protein
MTAQLLSNFRYFSEKPKIEMRTKGHTSRLGMKVLLAKELGKRLPRGIAAKLGRRSLDAVWRKGPL